MKIVHFIGGPSSGEVHHIPYHHGPYYRVAWSEPMPGIEYGYDPRNWDQVSYVKMHTAEYEIRPLRDYYVGVCIGGCKDPYA
ncbi:MAG: hypothetical protein GY906_13470 [bacterium]|nr:hypothetical protein [bacterium]